MISTNPNRPIAAPARDALNAVAAAQSNGSGGAAVAPVLEDLVGRTDASEADRALATFAKRVGERSLPLGAIATAQRIALQAIVDGIQGPLGPVLASAALRAVGDLTREADQRAIAHVALGAIADLTTSDSEKVLAATAKSACAQPLKQASGFAAQKAALTQLSGGVDGGVDAALIRFGRDAAAAISDAGNARSVGYTVLQGLSGFARDPSVATLAKAAYDASGMELTHAVGKAAQETAYAVLATAAGNPSTKVLAEYGKGLLEIPGQEIEGARLGSSVLQSVATEVIRAEDQLVAASAHRVSDARASDYDRITVQRVAFDTLLTGVQGSPEAVLADFGKACLSATRDPVNARSMGEIVISDMASATRDESVRIAAAKVIRKAQSGPGLIGRLTGSRDPDRYATEVLREGFDTVMEAVRAEQAKRDAVRDEKNMDEIKKMADALQPKPADAPKPPAAEVKVEEGAIVVGGIRIAKRPPRAQQSGDGTAITDDKPQA
ncbi:MAG: hypothetical protein FJX76_05050 [Armatimonadetes bacterium]|nr:hypothetical protein [Armatimonadota bacterium]